MDTASPRNPYYRLLALVARFFQDGRRSLRRKLVLVSGAFALLVWTARLGAWQVALRAGELPGTPAFERTAFAFLMAVLCAACLALCGLLAAAHWAQRAGRIPDYRLPGRE